MKKLSPLVVGALNAPSIGGLIPRAVVTSHDQKTFMASITYKSMKEPKTFRDANKQIEGALSGEKVELPKDLTHAWTIESNGRFFQGEFVELQGENNLILKSRTGKTFKVPLDTLSKGAQAYARVLAGAGAEKEEVAKKEFEIESWTNTEGKAIEAMFVSLKNGKITLKKKGGKVVTFDVSLLSEASQKRAKELAGE